MKGRAGVANNKRWWHWRYFGCLMLVILLGGDPSVHSLTSDGMALLAFKEGLKDPHHVLHNWRRTDENPCHWTGVQCNLQTKRVQILNLPRRHLVGTISSEIGKLDKLRRLGLHNNNFYGTIPSTIGNSTDLRALYLRNNVLSGPIPSELGMLQNLKVLDVSGNTLTGSIPASLGNLNNLVFLNLSSNSLMGSIPSPGALLKFTSASFIGNLGLCGHQLNQTCETSAASANGMKASKASNRLMVGALGTVAASLCLSLFCFWGFLLYSKFGSKPCAAQVDSSQAAKLVLFHGDLPYTSIEILKKIEQLGYKDVIGAGGFGMVYRLVMDEGSVFAVKKIGKGGGLSSERLFDRELEILGSIKHRNLVNLRGYCNAPSARLLIYDYLSCGSLDELLHEKKEGRDSLLNWGARLNIAVGAARGLAYLHHDCTPCIIHRDIKSSNILLDDHLEPHVSDFGLARLLEENDSHVTTIVAGTFGYLAPEYMQNGRATEKSDVYSYGVVLLELLSGKRPTDVMFIARGLNIVGWASGMIRENRCLEIFDPYCRGAQLESMEAVLQVAAMCIRPRPEERPSMAKVVKFLEAEVMSPCPSDFYDSYSE